MNMGIDSISSMLSQTGNTAANSSANALQDKAGSNHSTATDE